MQSAAGATRCSRLSWDNVITAIGQESRVPSVCQWLYGQNAQHPHFNKAFRTITIDVRPIISDMLRE
jgi:hypothetical protein